MGGNFWLDLFVHPEGPLVGSCAQKSRSLDLGTRCWLMGAIEWGKQEKKEKSNIEKIWDVDLKRLK